MTERKCRFCQEPGPRCACVRMCRRGVPAYTVDDEVKGIVCAIRGEISDMKRWILYTDYELGAKAREILDGKLGKMDWLAHNAFRVLVLEGDITTDDSVPEPKQNTERQDKELKLTGDEQDE